jgi:hypothetical protein
MGSAISNQDLGGDFVDQVLDVLEYFARYGARLRDGDFPSLEILLQDSLPRSFPGYKPDFFLKIFIWKVSIMKKPLGVFTVEDAELIIRRGIKQKSAQEKRLKALERKAMINELSIALSMIKEGVHQYILANPPAVKDLHVFELN